MTFLFTQNNISQLNMHEIKLSNFFVSKSLPAKKKQKSCHYDYYEIENQIEPEPQQCSVQ